MKKLILAIVLLFAACANPKVTELTCPDGDTLVSLHGQWQCKALNAIAGTTGATGATGPAGTLALPTCGTGQYLTSDGTTLSCADLASVTYACPPGYTTNALPEATWSGATLCTATLSNGATDEMVRAGNFWIDRYEMSALSCVANGDCPSGLTCTANVCGNLGAAPGFTSDGTDGGPAYDVTTAIGVSVTNEQPTENPTWFQAAQMCANAGKELCTNEEWQIAASGTNDPGTWPQSTGCGSGALAGAGYCNTCSGAARVTGLGSASNGGACYSTYGAEDMIGNVWEWVADWGQAGLTWGSGTTPLANPSTPPWGVPFGDGADETWNLNGTAYGTSTWMDGLPAVALRGGDWSQGSGAGAFALDLRYAPSAADGGARCCVRGR